MEKTIEADENVQRRFSGGKLTKTSYSEIVREYVSRMCGPRARVLAAAAAEEGVKSDGFGQSQLWHAARVVKGKSWVQVEAAY